MRERWAGGVGGHGQVTGVEGRGRATPATRCQNSSFDREASGSGVPMAVPYHRGEVLHGLGVNLGHLPGSQLGGDIWDRHLHFRLSAQTPPAAASRDETGHSRDRGALWGR